METPNWYSPHKTAQVPLDGSLLALQLFGPTELPTFSQLLTLDGHG